MRLRNVWVSVLGLTFATSLVACGGGQETSSKSAAPSSPAAATGAQKVDTTTAGDVKGTVTLDGTVGFVHQHFLLVSEFTIAENLALAVGRKGSVDFDREA